MPDWGGALFDIGKDLAHDWARYGSRHLQHAIGMPGAKKPGAQGASGLPEMPKVPEIPPLNIPPMPEHLRATPAFASAAPAASALGAVASAPASGVSDSTTQEVAADMPEDMGAQGDAPAAYGDEWEDLSIACAPCTIRHLSTMTTELKAALTASSDAAKQLHLATWASEGLVWLEFDVTPEKLQRARTDRERLAIAQAAASMRPVLDSFPMAPPPLVNAWGAIAEAQRFGRNAERSERDEAQVNIRMREINGWVGSLDTHHASDPAMQAHLDAIRKARHNWTREGYTPDALMQGEATIKAATVAMTPVPDDATIERAYQETRAARDAFYAAIMANKGRLERRDVDRDLPRELKGARLDTQTAQAPLNELLGATPATDAAFRGILKMQELRGVPVRVENLPPVIERGQIVGTIQGAYLPSGGGNVWLSPAAVSESPNGLFTLAHESVHSLLHSPACDIYPGTDDYANDPHEHEANCAAALALMDMGLPFEDDEGHRIDSREVKLDLAAMERRLSKRGMARVQWAAGILQTAMRGDPERAARESGACPR